MAILSLPLTAHWTTLHCLPERSEGPGLLAVAHCTMTTTDINTKGKILRFAQDDHAKMFNLWKLIGCCLIHEHSSAPTNKYNTGTRYPERLVGRLNFLCGTFLRQFHEGYRLWRKACPLFFRWRDPFPPEERDVVSRGHL